VDRLAELHRFVYKNVATKLLNKENMVNKMTSARFDQKDVTTVHNPYVDSLVQDVNVINGRLSSLGDKRIPKKAQAMLWVELFNIMNRVFIEG
jgi:hypothetical protein